MTIISTNFAIETDQHGMAVITQTGRCTANEAANVEAYCTRRYELVTLPNMSGIVFKSLDGTLPLVVSVTPTTIGRTYLCVKVDGRCEPLAPVQTAGPYLGSAIVRYRIVYQQVGAVT